MRKLKLLLLLTLLMTVGGVSLNAQNAGTYYIKNVGTGKWLGPGNSWGTQASVLQHADYWKAAKISDGVYTLESVVSNGGTSYYLTGTYCDGGATNFTFTPIAGKENTYSISNAGGGYLTTNGTTVDVSATDGSAEASQWKLYSESDMTAVMAAATVDNPADATYLIKDHDLGRNNRDYSSAWSNTGATAPKTNEGGAASNRYSIEAYHATFDVNQTLSSIPNGVYAIRVNGFYRQDGSNANLPYVYAGDSKTTLPVRTGSENSMQAAAVSFEAGNYLSEPAYVRVDNGTLKIGVKTEGNSCWVIFKNFHLQYYGNVTLAEVLLHEYVVAYRTALANAQSYQDKNMFSADLTVLNAAISANTIDMEGTVTEEMLTTATANLNAAATAAAKAVVKKTAFDNIVTAIEGKTDVNITSYIANLGFEDGNLNAWTSVDGGGVATNNNFSGKVGSYFVERWQNGVALGSGSLTHDVITLPTGVYTITANAQNIEQYNSSAAGTGYFFCVNDTRKEIGAAGTYTNVVKYTAQTDVTLKFLLEDCTGNWISCDNIQIVYNGEDFPAVTLVEGKMKATVAAAQTSAKEAYDADPTVDNYNTLVEAIAAAQASKNAYEHLGAAITKIDAALAAATTATETDDDAYQTIKTAYNNGTIENANIQANINNAYDAVIAIIKSQTATSADFTMAIKNQSFEYGDMTGWTATASSDTGVRETANGTYAATGTDGYYLFNTWWQGVPLTQTVTGLPNGQYTLTASVASDGATIYLIGNGEHNEGIETAGEYPSSDVMQETTFTFLVKDGTATIGVVGGADGTAGEHKDYVAAGYWWYKADNFRLQKNRDLTPEEAAIKPTAIALKVGDDEVTEVALNATTNTVTLTPSYTPADASEGYITWVSSDETVATVANGVVTGVTPGTAIITATSTLDEDVKATATVTVTYPESEVPETYYVNNNATRTIYTPVNNLIKNGAFEYPNTYYGWTVGTGAAMSADGFEVLTEDGNTYIKSKKGEGGGAVTSIKIGWPIENGKTYVFSYKIKGNAGKSSWTATSLTNTIGTETSMIEREFNVTTDWQEKKYTFTNTDGYAYLQFWARWYDAAYDDFCLAEVETATKGNVDYAKAAIPTANIGTGAFQYSQAAIDAANALVQGEATVEDVQNAYDAVTTLNVPEETQAYNLVFSCDGHTYTGNALTLIPNPAQTQGLYGLKYQAPANVNLAQAFYFVHTTGNKYKVFAVDTDGNDRYITTQAEGYGTSWYEGIRTITDASKAMEIEIRPNGEGLYLLWNTGANKPLAHNGNNNNDLFTNNTANFQFVETTKPAIAINTTAAGWGTVMLPFAQELPAEVKAYTCDATENDRLTLTEVDALEANKPYLIEGAWNAIVTGDAQGIALNYTEGLFTGVYEATAAPVGSYVLQNKNEKLGFYKVVETKQPNVGSNHAYLTVPASARDAFFFGEGETTAISTLKALSEGTVEIYSLNGVKQSKLQKGTNILKMSDGSIRKVMVK